MMKRKIYNISYIFDEKISLASKFGFELLKILNIYDNVVLHYFRIKSEKLNLTSIDKNEFKLYKDKNRDDNFFIYFPAIKYMKEILGIYDLEFHEYPSEISYHSINCSFTYYINNLIGGNINKFISENIINFSVDIYEGLIDMKLNRNFYKKRKSELDLLIEEWESTLSNIKIRKLIK